MKVIKLFVNTIFTKCIVFCQSVFSFVFFNIFKIYIYKYLDVKCKIKYPMARKTKWGSVKVYLRKCVPSYVPLFK